MSAGTFSPDGFESTNLAIENTRRKGRALSLEGLEGLEPSTRGLRGRCSNQLSYRPAIAGSTGKL
jgi:hypothetical protein